MKVMKQVIGAPEIKVHWVEDDSDWYVYEAIPSSMARNEKEHSIRFELKEVNSDDHNFEIMVYFRSSLPYAKIDYPGLAGTEYALTAYTSGHNALLYMETGKQKAYFHFG